MGILRTMTDEPLGMGLSSSVYSEWEKYKSILSENTLKKLRESLNEQQKEVTFNFYLRLFTFFMQTNIYSI